MLPTAAAHGRTCRFETAGTNGTAPTGNPAGWVVKFHDGVSLVLESTVQRACVENHAPQSSMFSTQISQHKRTTSGAAPRWGPTRSSEGILCRNPVSAMAPANDMSISHEFEALACSCFRSKASTS